MIMKQTVLELKVKALKPVQRSISPVAMASSSQKLGDGRRVICTARRHPISGKTWVEWFIDQLPVTEVHARVALANG